MAHEIDMSNSRANMAYVGDTPWHGLGFKLTADASIDTWTKEAGLDWTIESAPCYFYPNENGPRQALPNQRVLHRSDTGLPLSIMSKNRYKVVQPSDIMGFYNDLVGASGNFQLETAGSLSEGRKIWALAKYKEEIDISGDIIKPYLMLTTSCDGTLSTTAQFTTVRVVCNNTLQLSLRTDQATSIKVPHSRDFNQVEVKRELGLVEVLQENFAQDMMRLIETRVSTMQAAEIFEELYIRRDEHGEVLNQKHADRVVADLIHCFKFGPGAELETANGTAWGLLNAVTHHEDHVRKANSVDSRFRSAQFGDGRNHKLSALEMVNAL
jgi:phage/plasmid-like protein (TIGR03299 family)